MGVSKWRGFFFYRRLFDGFLFLLFWFSGFVDRPYAKMAGFAPETGKDMEIWDADEVSDWLWV